MSLLDVPLRAYLRHISLFAVLLSVHLPPSCQGQQTHCITPNYTTTPCTNYILPCLTAPCTNCTSSCFTLDDYVNRKTSEKFLSDTTIVFLPGMHYLNADEHIIIRGIRNLTLRGLGSPTSGSGGSLSHIVCTSGSGLYLVNTTNIEISNLTISQCGGTVSASLLAVDVYNFDISHTVIKNSTGYALGGINILGNCIISNSFFLYNNYDILESEDKDIHTLCQNRSLGLRKYRECVGGGAIFFYQDDDYVHFSSPQLHKLRVISSTFSHGINFGLHEGSGLTVYFDQSLYGVELTVEKSVFTHNTAHTGANMAFSLCHNVYNTSVTIQDCNSTNSNPLFTSTLQNIRNRDYIGGGMYFSNFYHCHFTYSKSEQNLISNVLKIYNTNFINNSGVIGAALSLNLTKIAFTDDPLVYIIENCSFVNNSGSPGSALAVSQVDTFGTIGSQPSLKLAIQLVFRNCSFFGNSYPSIFRPNSIQNFEQDLFNVVFLNLVQDITFINCIFKGNNGTALYTYGTHTRFLGDVYFQQNVGWNGGGLSLNGDSLMLLLPKTHMYILDNSAQNKGGGIFVVNQKLAGRQACFFQIDLRNLSNIRVDYEEAKTISDLDIQLVLERNNASKAGTALYGGTSDDDCFLLQVGDRAGWFDQLFHCDNTTCKNSGGNSPSLITSDPFQIRFCDEATNVPKICRLPEPVNSDLTFNVPVSNICSLLPPQIMVYPGQTFHVSVSIFGQRMGLSPGFVFANFLPEPLQERSILKPSQEAQEVNKTCTMLNYTIYSQVGDLNMILTLEDATILEDPTNLTIHVLPCPLGFSSTLSPQLSCQCDSFLQFYNIHCDIKKGTVHRAQEQWLSKKCNKGNDTNTKEILFHEHCPFDYCLQEELDLNLSNPDKQCAFNRTGILCGKCLMGLSAIFGGSQCVACSDAYLALIIPFAAAGLCLVLLLFVFNTLTVATGYLNGLIFYANIVQYNRLILFPHDRHTGPLTVFISWINLDLGIQTCFYNGMDTYANTWLQFVFPIYIWIIVVAIVIASKYSSRVAMLAGKNAVPVLATLGLLSFSKIIRTFITVVSFTPIHHSDGGTTTRWLFDANIMYLTGVHIPLFLISTIGLLFLVLPFAILLTFTSQLLTLSSHHPFKWVNRLKPFFDAYQGPYKDEHRYWTGVLLFVRGLLFIIYSSIFHQSKGILLVTMLASFLLIAYGWWLGGVYKKQFVNALELSFYLNLGFLASASLYIKNAGGSQASANVDVSQAGAIYTSISIALLEFAGVMVYSVILNLRSRFGWTSIKEFRDWVLYRCHHKKSDPASMEDMKLESCTVTSVSMAHDSCEVLRESMLEDEPV